MTDEISSFDDRRYQIELADQMLTEEAGVNDPNEIRRVVNDEVERLDGLGGVATWRKRGSGPTATTVIVVIAMDGAENRVQMLLDNLPHRLFNRLSQLGDD